MPLVRHFPASNFHCCHPSFCFMRYSLGLCHHVTCLLSLLWALRGPSNLPCLVGVKCYLPILKYPLLIPSFTLTFWHLLPNSTRKGANIHCSLEEEVRIISSNSNLNLTYEIREQLVYGRSAKSRKLPDDYIEKWTEHFKYG